MLDIQQGMLDKTAARLNEAGIANFSTHLFDGERLPFKDPTRRQNQAFIAARKP